MKPSYWVTLTLTLRCVPPPPCKQALKSPPPKTVKARNYKSFDPELFSADLNRVPWDIIKLESDRTKREILLRISL